MTLKFPLNMLSTVARHEVVGLINMEKKKSYEQGIRDICIAISPDHETESVQKIIDRMVKEYDPKI